MNKVFQTGLGGALLIIGLLLLGIFDALVPTNTESDLLVIVPLFVSALMIALGERIER